MTKLKEVFKSWRFWAVFLIALGNAINELNTGSDFVATLVKFITFVAGGAAAIRTVDRFGEKVGEIPAPKQ